MQIILLEWLAQSCISVNRDFESTLIKNEEGQHPVILPLRLDGPFS